MNPRTEQTQGAPTGGDGLSVRIFKESGRYRVMVCGSRSWTDFDRVMQRLSDLPLDTVVMQGMAFGADMQALDAAHELSLEVESYPPDAGRPSPQRYHERNDAMLNRADLVLCFWDGKSRGTASVLRKARERGIPVEVHS